MKTLSLIAIAIVLGLAVFARPVHAEDPAALPPELQAMIAELLKMADPAHLDSAQAQKLTPEIEAMLAQLLKSAMAELPADTAPVDPSATTSTAPVVPAATSSGPANTHDAKASLGTTGLRTSSLTSGGLMPSAALGGRGTSGVATRLSEADWRALFPKKQDSK